MSYPFNKGHVAYYSGSSLVHIAKKHRMSVDFRVPKCAIGIHGPRKRYIFFYKTHKIQEGLARFFSKHMYAYSEP